MLADVQQLNIDALAKTFPVTKISFFCLGHVLDNYIMLPSGAALGYGCGPKIIAKEKYTISDLSRLRIAIPGIHTTAHLLLNLLTDPPAMKVFCRYNEISNLIKDDEVDCGLIIHESRFTFAQEGFHEIADLGQLWENTFRCPIPLGCIAAKRSLGHKRLKTISDAIRSSLLWGINHPEASEEYIQTHCMVKDTKVIKEHIHLYVNKETEWLSPAGLRSIELLLSEAHKKNLIPKLQKNYVFIN